MASGLKVRTVPEAVPGEPAALRPVSSCTAHPLPARLGLSTEPVGSPLSEPQGLSRASRLGNLGCPGPALPRKNP